MHVCVRIYIYINPEDLCPRGIWKSHRAETIGGSWDTLRPERKETGSRFDFIRVKNAFTGMLQVF